MASKISIPPTIIKQSKYMYRDSKNGKLIHVKNLESYCASKEKATEYKPSHEDIIEKRWDLNY